LKAPYGTGKIENAQKKISSFCQCAWIRILIFSSLAFKKPAKINLFFVVVAYYLGTFTSVFKDSKSLRSPTPQRFKIRFFFILLLVDGKVRIREALKLPDPTVPDPEHWKN
jgi:hypothetical protein